MKYFKEIQCKYVPLVADINEVITMVKEFIFRACLYSDSHPKQYFIHNSRMGLTDYFNVWCSNIIYKKFTNNQDEA